MSIGRCVVIKMLSFFFFLLYNISIGNNLVAPKEYNDFRNLVEKQRNFDKQVFSQLKTLVRQICNGEQPIKFSHA